MHQMKFLFNGVRLPGTGPGGIDEVHNYFNTGKNLTKLLLMISAETSSMLLRHGKKISILF